jgi:hypothetical protein
MSWSNFPGLRSYSTLETPIGQFRVLQQPNPAPNQATLTMPVAADRKLTVSIQSAPTLHKAVVLQFPHKWHAGVQSVAEFCRISLVRTRQTA